MTMQGLYAPSQVQQLSFLLRGIHVLEELHDDAVLLMLGPLFSCFLNELEASFL